MKRKKVGDERRFLIVLPEDEKGAEGLDMLAKDGPVHGVLVFNQVAVAASESQLKALTRAGVNWEYARAPQGGKDGKRKGGGKGKATVPSARHHRTRR